MSASMQKRSRSTLWPASEFLRFQETLVNSGSEEYDWNLEVDLSPFSRGFPRMKEKKSIGRGVEFLNRHLSTLLFAENSRGSQMLLDFLRVHKYRRQQLMLNNRIIDLAGLQEALREAEEYLTPETGGHAAFGCYAASCRNSDLRRAGAELSVGYSRTSNC